MNEPPGARLRVALTALSIAEYFRDEEKRMCFLFIDNIFRFTQAGSEVSALLGRIPSAVGYQPTLATEMGELQERITSTKSGSITSVQAVYVPADDLTDPAPATTFAHLDSTVVLARSLAELGIYPAVDPLDSTSTALTPDIIGKEHYEIARGVQKFCKGIKIFKILSRSLNGRIVRSGQIDGKPREKNPEVFIPAVFRGRSLYRSVRQICAAVRDFARV